MLILSKNLNINSFTKLYRGFSVQPCRKTHRMSHLNKRLAAFDFDSTIIVDNSDTIVRDLLPKDTILKFNQHSADGWTDYMQNVFELLHEKKIDENTITRTVSQIPAIDGMVSLIKQLSQTLNFDLIIISDSNSYFISKWLEEQDLKHCFKGVFTNPGKFIDGLLKIEMYHIQDWCKLSTRNLCKGQILEDFIKSQNEAGVTYSNVIYIGDGQNDFCPILRLKSNDLACCREGFKCAHIVKDVQSGKPFKETLYQVKANVLLWKNGSDILDAVKQL